MLQGYTAAIWQYFVLIVALLCLKISTDSTMNCVNPNLSSRFFSLD